MPPEPIFKSSRSQSAAVALLTAMILLGSAGLAYLQAGDKGPSNSRTPNPPSSPAQELRLSHPKDWLRTQSAPGTTVLADPDRPARQLRIIHLQSGQPTPPEQMLDRCISTRINASARETLRQSYPRIVFTSDEFGFTGAEFLGISHADESSGPQDSYEQHLLACLSNDGVNYWLLYLTDTTVSGEDIEQSLKHNTSLLRAVYRSARFTDG